jgi:hypothetical protein
LVGKPAPLFELDLLAGGRRSIHPELVEVFFRETKGIHGTMARSARGGGAMQGEALASAEDPAIR